MKIADVDDGDDDDAIDDDDDDDDDEQNLLDKKDNDFKLANHQWLFYVIPSDFPN